MREIKFRGKAVQTGKWLYGYLQEGYTHSSNYQDIGFYIREKVGKVLSDNEVWTGSIGQYTGLKDKNEILIYEGDIVERKYYHNNPPSKRPKVKFILAKLQVIFSDGEFTLDDNSIRNTDYGTTFNKWWGDGCEIIGNIYENATLVQ